MRRQKPELTDDDLRRLAHLGAALDQIAEAAGIDVSQVRSRLAGAPELASAVDVAANEPALCR